MYAIIKTGGKQYRVAAGDKIKVETIEAEVGAQVTLTEVLAVSNGTELTVGAPVVEVSECHQRIGNPRLSGE